MEKFLKKITTPNMEPSRAGIGGTVMAADHYCREANSIMGKLEYLMDDIDTERAEILDAVGHLIQAGVSNEDELDLVQVSNKSITQLREGADTLSREFSENLISIPTN